MLLLVVAVAAGRKLPRVEDTASSQILYSSEWRHGIQVTGSNLCPGISFEGGFSEFFIEWSTSTKINLVTSNRWPVGVLTVASMSCSVNVGTVTFPVNTPIATVVVDPVVNASEAGATDTLAIKGKGFRPATYIELSAGDYSVETATDTEIILVGSWPAGVVKATRLDTDLGSVRLDVVVAHNPQKSHSSSSSSSKKKKNLVVVLLVLGLGLTLLFVRLALRRRRSRRPVAVSYYEPPPFLDAPVDLAEDQEEDTNFQDSVVMLVETNHPEEEDSSSKPLPLLI